MDTETNNPEQTASVSSGSTDMSHAAHPMRNLLLLLPYLSVNDSQEIDYEAANPDLLVQLADNAEAVSRILHLGIAAVGRLLVYSASRMDGSELSGDTLEALGHLLAELGEVADIAQSVVMECRRYTFDYTPQDINIIPNVKP